METNRIKEILDRYFEGTSSMEEEKLLHRYFSSDTVDAELLPYRELFAGISELQNESTGQFEEEIMDFILKSNHKKKNKVRYLWQAVSTIAAIILIALFVVNYQQYDQWEDTYNDPNVAYAEATKTLQFVGEKYTLGIAQLHPMKKINKAVTPLDKGLNTVNKGLQEIDNLKHIEEIIKQQ